MCEHYPTSSDIPSKIYLEHPNTTIYPNEENIFKAFQLCPEDQLKVIIIGQDCYHQKNQATGLWFAVNNDQKIPPSLRNIIQEVNDNVGKMTSNIDLISWAQQGVLLLNSSLTVEHGKPGSHMKYWEDFTDNIINQLSTQNSDLIFCLWGKYAQKKKKFINSENDHLILTAAHPSPLSANRGGWFGCNHFNIINDHLISIKKKEIIW